MGNDFWFESTGVSQKNEGGVWFEKSEFSVLFFKEKQTEELDSKSLTSRNELFLRGLVRLTSANKNRTNVKSTQKMFFSFPMSRLYFFDVIG